MTEQSHFTSPDTDMANPEIDLARQLAENTGVNIFLTGRAGTGKTTFLRNLRASSSKRMVVTAPTGIAAINAGGVTLHSFFQLPFAPFAPAGDELPRSIPSRKFSKDKLSIIRSLDLLVIDEISMVRGDLLDAVDSVLRFCRRSTLPFGGVQLLMIGDPQQLPPVVTEEDMAVIREYYQSPYFFESHALRRSGFVTVELQKVYRQNEGEFLDILNAMRDNNLTDAHLETLNARYSPEDSCGEGVIRLTTHNAAARRINEERLAAIPQPEHMFDADVEGVFPETSFPADSSLRLKEGAQVMFIRNDSTGQRRYYNGLIGKIVSIDADAIMVDTPDDLIKVAREEWDNNRYVIDPETREIKETREGSFRQYPLRLAWAITIHKSQGLTFDKAVIDASRSFAHGQAYVALSRCRSLDGLALSAPLSRDAVICDPVVAAFTRQYRALQPSPENLEAYKADYTLSALGELLNLRPLYDALCDYRRVVDEAFSNLYPQLCADYGVCAAMTRDSMAGVAARFLCQLRADNRQVEQLLADSAVALRIANGMKYFLDKISEIAAILCRTPENCDNKEVSARLSARRADLEDRLRLHTAMFRLFSAEPFSAAAFTAEKGKVMSKFDSDSSNRAKRRKDRHTVADEVSNPLLFERLCEWRRRECEIRGVKGFQILSTRALKEIAETKPTDLRSLLRVAGIGKKKAQDFGGAILQITTHPDFK